MSSYKDNAPICSTFGCGRKATYRHKNKDGTFNYHNHCSKHHKMGSKSLAKKHYCENIDGHLGFGKCSTTVTSSSQLDIDHIDGNRYNNNPNNLQTLCKVCHAEKTKRCKDNIVRYNKKVKTTFDGLFSLL